MYWKYFVQATEDDKRGSTSSTYTARNIEIKAAEGKEIKEFYEEVIKLPAQQVEKKTAPITPRAVKVKHRKAPASETNKQPLNIIGFFKAAQNNDISRLKDYILSGFDINTTDTFHWTALMCASAQGALDSANFLINHGANITATDKSGRDAATIAKTCGHKNVAEQLTRIETIIKTHQLEQSTKPQQNTDKINFYCGVCEEKFEKTTPYSHQTSTLHLFCSQPEVKDSAVYQIPEHNVGFRLLLKDGWNREKGLGPKEDGRKYPVKTVLKRDRKGLGVGSKSEMVARVTHFSPGDLKAVENVYRKNGEPKTTRSQRRRVEKFNERRERRKEKCFRRMFNDN